MIQPYKLAENVSILKTRDHYNIYITSNNIYFVSVDKFTPELKKLKHTYNIINGVGIRFGALGALITAIPLEIFVVPRIKKEYMRALDMLRNIDVSELKALEGYGCARAQITFEEKKKDRYRVHIGENWLLLSGDDARTLQTALI